MLSGTGASRSKSSLASRAAASSCASAMLRSIVATKAGAPCTLSANQIFSAAYLDSFDPANLCDNYLGDIGASPLPTGSYSFNVPAGRTFIVVVHEVKPRYTPAAMQQRIQGSVFLHVVIGETGDVTNVTVTESLDREYGLDDEAVRAAWQWKFKPGTKDGKPVPVRVTIQLTFTLKK